MAKKVFLTPEQIQEQKLARDYEDLMSDDWLLPDPTYFFEVGDRVSLGNLQDAYIVGVPNNNYRMYEIDYTDIDNNYGRPIYHYNQRRIVSWLQVRPYTNVSEVGLIKNSDIRINFSNRQISDIIYKRYDTGINFNVDYQRDYVWSIYDKQNLIKSIFNNIEIGRIVFSRLPFKHQSYTYNVIDGKQRINAICEFYENRFPIQGYYFNDLGHREQDYFENFQYLSAEVEGMTKEQELRMFIMLNSSGKTMSQKDINHAIDLLNENISP